MEATLSSNRVGDFTIALVNKAHPAHRQAWKLWVRELYTASLRCPKIRLTH